MQEACADVTAELNMAAGRNMLLGACVGVRALSAVLCRQSRLRTAGTRLYVTNTAKRDLQFKLDERTAHSSLDLFKKDMGVIYRVLGLDPTLVPDNPERFLDWAVVLGDSSVMGGRHYWEVTVSKSQEFRIGVADPAMSREECVGTNSCSWVFSYVHRKWYAMTTNKMAPIALVVKPDRVGLLLDYEGGRLDLVDPQNSQVVHSIKASFKSPLCPAFALWDGELLAHSGLAVPEGLA